MCLSDNLKDLRENHLKLTQVQFAATLGTGQSIVNKWETAKASPGAKYLDLIREKFGVNINWLLTGEGEPLPGKEKPEHRPGVQYIQPSGEDRYVSSVRPLYNNKEGEPAAQAEIRVSDALVAASRVLDSRTSYATALFLNIQHFDRAIQAERSLHQLTEENRQLKARVAALEKECEDLRKRLAALEARVSCNPRETVAAA